MDGYSYVGNCVNSFDDDGNTVGALPYRDVSDFAVHEESAVRETRREFLKHVEIPPELQAASASAEAVFLHDEDSDVRMLYDPDADIHSFFARM